MKPSMSEHNRSAYVEALDAILLARSDVLDVDATFDSIMLLREDLAGVPFQYPPDSTKGAGTPNAPYRGTYFLDAAPDGSVVLRWVIDQTTVTITLTPDRAARLGADLKGFAEHLLSFQESDGS